MLLRFGRLSAMTETAAAAPRAIRDAGDVTIAGRRPVRTGVLFRISGDLVTAADLKILEDADVHTVVDLRSIDEPRETLERWAMEHGVRYVHQPMLSATITELMQLAIEAPDFATAREQQRQVYLELIDAHGAEFARTLEIMASPGATGVGCAAGKDRTGLMTAIVHVLIGASVDEAAAAYVAQAPSVAELRPLALARIPTAGEGDLPPGIMIQLGVDPALIAEVFTHIDTRYGGVEPWLERYGLTAGTVAALRAKLLN